MLDFLQLNDIIKGLNSPSSKEDVVTYFNAIAGQDKAKCCNDPTLVLNSYGIRLTGNDLELTYKIFLDCVVLLSSKEGDAIHLQSPRAAILAGKHKVSYKKSSKEECVNYLKEKFPDISSELEEVDDDSLDWDDDDSGDTDESLFEETDELETETDDLETEKDTDLEDEEDVEEIPLEDAEIVSFFDSNIHMFVTELAFRYRGLFESGYGVKRPYGVLANGRVLHLSGNKSNASDGTDIVDNIVQVDIVKMYGVIEKAFQGSFETSEDRSITKIVEKLYDTYNSGDGKLVYFPYKMLEFAYGKKKPSGANKNSLNTYEKHSSATSWAKYEDVEITSNQGFSVKRLIKEAVIRFVKSKVSVDTVTTDDLIDLMDDVIEFLKYVQASLSLCFILPEYVKNNKGEITLFKLRLCDPYNYVKTDITQDIIREAYLGGIGSTPFSIPPIRDERTFVKSFGHEFDHDSAQAKPLFSYKAFDICKENGLDLTWDNMILGEYKDGSILTNGMHGLNLSRILIHNYIAGSRAGKGVMTLNMLAAGIKSDKAIFYLDDKPDMGSMLRSLSYDMFVVNGAAYDTKYDEYNGKLMFGDRFENINMGNIPDYLLEALNRSPDWDGLGSLFYMRALKLTLGIILARGVTKNKTHLENLGGDSGVLVVVDELTGFDDNFGKLVERFIDLLPPKSYREDKDKVNEKKLTQDKLDNSYNDAGYYAITYLRALLKDMEKQVEYGRRSFSSDELGKSDIFSIGQSADYNFVSAGETDIIGARYKIAGSGTGVTSAGRTALSGIINASFPYTLINFRPADAFFGRNDKNYLGQEKKVSEAYGRLDDKASNFAYIEKYTEAIKNEIVSEDLTKNVKIASSAVYFKPYLVLNDCTDTYISQMLDRCTGLTEEQKNSEGYNSPNARITQDQIVAEYLNDGGNGLHPAIGFPGYLRHMQVDNVDQVLAKSGKIANYVVQDLLKYPGTWRDFITDLRPEWCFTLEDIVHATLDGKTIGIHNPATYDVCREFYQFNPEAFGGVGCDTGFDVLESDGSFDLSDLEDESFSNTNSQNTEQVLKTTPEEVYNIDSTHMTPEEVEDITVFDSFDRGIQPEEDDISIFNSYDFVEPIHGYESDPSVVPHDEEIIFSESFDRVQYQEGVEDIGDIQRMLEKLEAMGYDASIKKRGSELDYDKYNAAKPLDDFSHIKTSVLDSDYTSFSGSDVSDYERLVNLITEDIIKKYQGLDRINTFKVVGGTIVINKYAYQCRLGKNMTAKLPYDLRREINSGNISTLFNYSLLYRMSNLRELVFDSTDFVHDYVSKALGYGSCVSVDLFFKDLRQLKILGIGQKVFRRETYWDEIKDDDVFYTPKASEKFLDMSGKLLGEKRRKAWNFTKNQVKGREYGLIVKALGVSGGLVMTTAVVGAEAAAKGSRKLLGGFGSMVRQFSNMLKE